MDDSIYLVLGIIIIANSIHFVPSFNFSLITAFKFNLWIFSKLVFLVLHLKVNL